MTNLQIIAGAITLYGITEEVDTYAGWQRRGYQVQRGQKALFNTKIWKPCKWKKVKEESAESETGTPLILVNASFFGLSQVAKDS